MWGFSVGSTWDTVYTNRWAVQTACANNHTKARSMIPAKWIHYTDWTEIRRRVWIARLLRF